MQATILQPCADLRDAVDVFWYHAGDGVHRYTVSIPFLHQELILNLGDRFAVTKLGGRAVEYCRSGTVSGLSSVPMITQVEGRYEAMGVLLKPYGLYRLFGTDMSLLTSEPQPLSRVLKIPADFLQQLAACLSGLEKLQLLQQCLLQTAQPVPLPTAVADVYNAPPCISKGSVKALVHNVSHKKYIRSFTRALGFTPQRYTHLRMVNDAIAAIAANPDTPLTEIAYEKGFYDQAHFIRIFKAVAAMTPSAFRTAVRQKQVHTAFPNTIIW